MLHFTVNVSFWERSMSLMGLLEADTQICFSVFSRKDPTQKPAIRLHYIRVLLNGS